VIQRVASGIKHKQQFSTSKIVLSSNLGINIPPESTLEMVLMGQEIAMMSHWSRARRCSPLACHRNGDV